MCPVSAPIQPEIQPPPEPNRRFGDLRGVTWRISLGILPSRSPVDDVRRVTANSRRRYASLRRSLLVDPHLPKDGSNSPDRVMDNPLSQNPDSMWGRFFRNAELERMVDQDLSRLYPEHGSYFQTMGCQSTLRRILLLWCLKHPEYGYRQGMHELLAPLLYVLHADVEHLSEVRKLYEDHFVDKFDDFSFEENDLAYNFDFKKFSESRKDEIDSDGCPSKSSSVNELDPEVQDIVLLSDAYGAEGELGVVISDKFLEHDAYCMFDALMSGNGGAVSMAEFFSPSPLVNSQTGLPPVIEASSALYHLLSIVDSSIHSHLIELGVEPQYFALRWLRVLFGREFSLENLVIIWDEIFSCDNSKVDKTADDSGSTFAVLDSLRGAFISALAVSMILFLRSSVLATENATSCLQRLLNFPAKTDLKKLLAKTKSLQGLALEANNSTPIPLHNGVYEKTKTKPVVTRGHSRSVESISPRTPLSMVPESYWEEKWRDLHREEKLKQSSVVKEETNRKKGWSERVRLSLSRTESAPPSSKVDNNKNNPKFPVRRSLLEDLSKQLGVEEEGETTECIEEDLVEENSSQEEAEDQREDTKREKSVHTEDLGQKNSTHEEIEEHRDEATNKNIVYSDEEKNLSYSDEERCSNGSARSEGNSCSFSGSPGHHHLDSPCGRSSVGSSSSVVVKSGGKPQEESEGKNKAVEGNEQKPGSGLQDRKFLSGKFQWFWKFGRNNGGEGSSEKGGSEDTKPLNGASDEKKNNETVPAPALVINGNSNSLVSKGECADQNMMVSLRNLSQSMLDNIQVIESVFQQKENGQVKAMSALTELRKISNMLSEM